MKTIVDRIESGKHTEPNSRNWGGELQIESIKLNCKIHSQNSRSNSWIKDEHNEVQEFLTF